MKYKAAMIFVLSGLSTTQQIAFAQEHVPYSTEEVTNIISLCGAGIGIHIDADLQGSIKSIIDKEKTQGKAVQDVLAKIIELVPPGRRADVYQAYLTCVDRRLPPYPPPPPINSIPGSITLGLKKFIALTEKRVLVGVVDFKNIPLGRGEGVQMSINGERVDMYPGDQRRVPLYDGTCTISLADLNISIKRATFTTDCSMQD